MYCKICVFIFRMSLRTVSAVNSMSYEDYIAVFGNVIEHCSLCAAATWRDRPFTDVDSLHKSFCQFADMLPIGGKFDRDNESMCLTSCLKLTDIGIRLWCLMPLSTIFQLHRCSQFYW